MGRAPKVQASIFDTTIEDPALESMLAEAVKLEPVAAEYRKKRKDIRKHIETTHPALIGDEFGAADDDGDGEKPSGWIRCGNFRFKPKATEREEGEVKIGAGINWTCPVEAIA